MPAETLLVWVGVPSRETWWAENCPDVPLTDGDGAITGVVSFEISGEPAERASVSAQARHWRVSSRLEQYDPQQGQVVNIVAGRDGRYVLCGVEPDIPITLRAVSGDAESDSVVEWGVAGGIVRSDLVLRTHSRERE